jgi:hypothetical protein
MSVQNACIPPAAIPLINWKKFIESSFHPETAFFRRGGVNPQACLCGVPMYASSQPLDFLATTKNSSFPI